MNAFSITIVALIALVVWIIIERDPRGGRRSVKYFNYYKSHPRIVDELEIYLASKINEIFLNGQNKYALKSEMKINNIYRLYNNGKVLDEMEYERLIIDVERDHGIKLDKNDIGIQTTIADMAIVIKRKRIAQQVDSAEAATNG